MHYALMNKTEAAACSELAARAFANYEYFSMYVPNAERRARVVRNMMRCEFAANAGLVHTLVAKQEEQLAAVAMLRDPSYRMPGVMQYLMAGIWKALLVGGYGPITAWYAMDLDAAKPCQGLGGNLWLLNMLTVEPELAGQGIGSRMLQESIIPYVKEKGGSGLCLFTNSEINRRFYEKNGFQEFAAETFPYKGKVLGSWSYQMAW